MPCHLSFFGTKHTKLVVSFRLVQFLNEKFDLETENRVLFAIKVVTALINLCPQLRLCVESPEVSAYCLYVSMECFILFYFCVARTGNFGTALWIS